MKTLTLFLFFPFFLVSAQNIPENFFGLNAWMADTVGNFRDCKGKPYGINCIIYGKIHKNNTWELVKESGAKLIRFGGENADENKPTNEQYLKMVDSIRSKGMEPILQVPYNNNYYTADTAAAIVRYINITKKRNVKYWSIGNEPDLDPPYGYGYFSASPIADYVRQFAAKMKMEDSTIITLGPELKFYDDRNNLISELTTPGGYYDITGMVPGHTYCYIDIFTFHWYPFGGSQTREEVVQNLHSPWPISYPLDLLKAKLDSCNKYHGREAQRLQMAITESNLNYRNSTDPELNAHSFLAGQFWCELMGIGMEKGLAFIAFWSIIENSLGYIDERTWQLRPTYYHYKLMAENFKGKFCPSEIKRGLKNLKVIAAADTENITVMLLNQEEAGTRHEFKLRIANSNKSNFDNNIVWIKDKDAHSNEMLYSDIIEGESTMLLVLSRQGTLVKKYMYKKSDGENAVPKLSSDAGLVLFAK